MSESYIIQLGNVNSHNLITVFSEKRLGVFIKAETFIRINIVLRLGKYSVYVLNGAA